MSIASQLTKLETDISNAYDSIETKGGTIPQNQNTENLSNAIASIPTSSSPTLQNKSITITQNGNTIVQADSGYDGLDTVSITTNVSGGGGIVEEKDVNFYDYNGTILYSYTLNEIQQLSELPPLPSHSGLVCQGWNWNLADIKTYNKFLSVGAMYRTDDWSTRIYVTLESPNLSPTLRFQVDGTATVNWGDGTTDTITGFNGILNSIQHTYSQAGSYVISISSQDEVWIWGDPNSDISQLLDPSDYLSTINKIELGTALVGNNAFAQCTNLKTITTPYYLSPKSSKDSGYYYYRAFYSCSQLEYVTIPSSFTSNEIQPSSYHNIKYLGISMFGKSGIKNISIPNGVLGIRSGAFSECYNLEVISLPDTVTTFPDSTFALSYNLKKINIPSGITALPGATFKGCQSLKYLKFPAGLITIGNYCFMYVNGNAVYDFRNATSVPTFPAGTITSLFSYNANISRATAVSNYAPNSHNIKIIVPDNLYATWIGTSIWSSLTNFIIKASDYND